MTKTHALFYCSSVWLLLCLIWIYTLRKSYSLDNVSGKLERLQIWLVFALGELAVAGLGYVPVALLAVTLMAAAGCAEIASSTKAWPFVGLGVALAIPFAIADVAQIAITMATLVMFVFLLPYRLDRWLQQICALLLGMYVGLAPVALYTCRERPEVLVAVMITLTVSHLVDIISGFTGKSGRVKPLSRLSPNKTTLGFAAGAAVGVLLSVTLWVIGWRNFSFGLAFPRDLLAVVGMGLALWAATAAGDLVGSKGKRILGIKDYGKRLGQHGGYMDRLDAFVPAMLLGCIAAGV